MNTKSVMAMFVVLLLILVANPMTVNSIYNTILGRIVLIGIVVFFSINNITLGLLVALAIISALNQFGSFVEGMETMDAPVTIGEDNIPITGKQIVLTKSATAPTTAITATTATTTATTITPVNADSAKQKISDLKAKAATAGIDKEAIRNTIMSKDSKTIQIDPSVMKNEDVNAYNPSMLTNTSSMTEGFCPCAASAF
jgi:hypothetical protein